MKIKATFRFKPFSAKQLKILTWWCPGSPVRDLDGIIADGAIRSGKTLPMSLSFVLWAMTIFNQQNFGMCGKTIGAFRRNVLVLLKLMLIGRGYKVKDQRSDNLLVVRRGDVENYFYLFGGKDERSQDLIQGITLAGVYFDEVALMPESFVNQATGRCSVEGAKFWFNCNPDYPEHWFRKEWMLKHKAKRLLYLHFMMNDNPSLSLATLARYNGMYSGVFHDRFIKGLWSVAEGPCYPDFANDPEQYIIDAAPEDIIRVILGVDFGGTGSAHSFTATGITRGYRAVITLDEYYHDNKKDGRLSPAQLEKAFVDFVRQVQAKYRVYECYADSAEQTLIEGLQVAALNAGLGLQVGNALKMEINERIAFYNSIMAQGRYKIMRHCKATISALKNARYDTDKRKGGPDVRLDDGTTNIDSLDSMEYTTERLQRDIIAFGRITDERRNTQTPHGA